MYYFKVVIIFRKKKKGMSEEKSHFPINQEGSRLMSTYAWCPSHSRKR